MIVTVGNTKGGVGKTTIAVNLPLRGGSLAVTYGSSTPTDKVRRRWLFACGPKQESIRICVSFTQRPRGIVNAVINKRFAKKQQMQWSKRGTHLLLQD